MNDLILNNRSNLSKQSQLIGRACDRVALISAQLETHIVDFILTSDIMKSRSWLAGAACYSLDNAVFVEIKLVERLHDLLALQAVGVDDVDVLQKFVDRQSPVTWSQ